MLTKRQKEILDFIKFYTKKNDYSPTIEEIAGHLGVSSVSTVHEHLKKMADNGYIRREEHQPRAIEILSSEPMVQIQLAGEIAAGQPIEAIEEKETISIPKHKLPKKGEVFALKVSGNSMIDENINDGDIILVKQQSVADNGQKVVALINSEEATVKKYYKERGQVRLQPANKNIEPIIVKKGTPIEIQGIVVDVIKNRSTTSPKFEKREARQSKKQLKKSNIKIHLNKVFLGDVMQLLPQLPNNSVDMIFGDPDYNVGIKYGDKTYTRKFNEYIDWYIKLTKEAMRVLKEDGNLFIINYPKQNAHLRVKYLDTTYPLVSEYVWAYNTNVGHTPRRFTTAHRSILHIRKSKHNKFYKNNVALPYKNPTDKRIQQNIKNGSKGRMPYSWFEINLVKNVSKEKTYHACQIPQKLTKMLIEATTIPKDLVLVLFGGSGSELELCKKLNRNYISAEIDKKYHDLITDRLKNGYIKEEYRLQRNKTVHPSLI